MRFSEVCFPESEPFWSESSFSFFGFHFLDDATDENDREYKTDETTDDSDCDDPAFYSIAIVFRFLSVVGLSVVDQ